MTAWAGARAARRRVRRTGRGAKSKQLYCVDVCGHVSRWKTDEPEHASEHAQRLALHVSRLNPRARIFWCVRYVNRDGTDGDMVIA